MPSSSYSSYSSSSSCSTCSSSSSLSSSGASFTSCSTIVPPEQIICPFGSPEYNYFWIENKSKSNPKLSYFYNYKSHSVVWQRPVPNNICLPFYTHNLISRQENIPEEDDLIVSDNEDTFHKEQRLYVRKRNRRLATEDKENSIQLILINQAIKSKKMLDTFWKLYRYPGESKLDVKRRLLYPLDTRVQVKTERISSDCEYTKHNQINRPIKQETDENDDTIIDKVVNNISKTLEDDSDSDPEHVSFLIKQEYMMDNYTDSEQENGSSNVSEINQEIKKEVNQICPRLEEESDNDSDEDLDEDYIANEIDNCHIKIESFDEEEYSEMNFDNQEQYSLADLLNIEIQENDKENVFAQQSDTVHDDFINEEINWTFEKSSNTNNNISFNPLYKPPQHKKLSEKHFLPVKIKKKYTNKKRTPKLVIENNSSVQEKLETSFDPYKPIICDMYGIRTINYNYPPEVKVPKGQSCSRLSDSDSDSEFQKCNAQRSLISTNKISTKSPNPFFKGKRKPEDALELKNYFPNRNKKRKRKGSESSWYESNLSDYTDVDNFDVTLPKIKKEKDTDDFVKRRRSQRQIRKRYISYTYPSSEDDEIIIPKAQYKYTISSDNVLVAIIKREPVEPTTLPPPQETKKPKFSMPLPASLNPVVDLSLVKIELKSPDPEPDTCAITPITESKENDNDYLSLVKIEPKSPDPEPDTCSITPITESKENDSDGNSSDSSSSSYTCSRSSCSCSSCTSSSEDTDVDEKEARN